MESQYNINIPLNFNQVVDIVKQSSEKEKDILKRILENEQEICIPEEHKTLVRERMKLSKENPSILLKS